MTAPSSGEIVAARFVLEARAGEGGMGVVYRARDLTTGRSVAIKILHDGHPDSVARFHREVEALSQFKHPSIVGYIAHGTTANGRPFLAMDWLDGETLKARLQRGPLGHVESVDVALSVADALAAAHARGIVHRDLKPANILLVGGSTSDVRVLDFGVVRMKAAGPALTSTGDLIGTPAYMSPEQARGIRDLDGRSDIFSLGAVLFECLTGQRPFGGGDAISVLLKVASQRAANVQATATTNLPPALASVVDSMLSPNPAERPQSAAILLESLKAARAAIAANVSGAAAPLALAPVPPPAATERGRAPLPLSVRIAIAVGMGILLLGAGVVVGTYESDTVGGRSPDKRRLRPLASANPIVLQPPASSRPAAKPETICPPGALACAPSDAPDPTHANVNALISAAVTLARSVRPSAELTGMTANGISDGTIDLTTANVWFSMSSRVFVETSGATLVAMPNAGDFYHSIPIGACSVKNAYDAAVAAHLPTSPPAVLNYYGIGPTSEFTFTVMDAGVVKGSLYVDPTTCRAHGASLF